MIPDKDIDVVFEFITRGPEYGGGGQVGPSYLIVKKEDGLWVKTSHPGHISARAAVAILEDLGHEFGCVLDIVKPSQDGYPDHCVRRLIRGALR